MKQTMNENMTSYEKHYWAKVPKYITQNPIGKRISGMLCKTLLGKGSWLCYAKPYRAKVPGYVTQNPIGQRFLCMLRMTMNQKIHEKYVWHIFHGFVKMFYDVNYMICYARCICMNM